MKVMDNKQLLSIFDNVSQTTEEQNKFIPSKTFTESKIGYYFSFGSKGLGYYLDPKQSRNDSSIRFKRKIEELDVPHNEDDTSIDLEIQSTNVNMKISKEKTIEEMLEEAEKAGINKLDSISLKQMLISFDKKININQKMRMKYINEPEKFMESEIELYENIQELSALAAYPELYVDLIKNNSLISILNLLTHENIDIVVAIVQVLQELLEPDTIYEEESAIILVDEFIKNQGFELIVQNLQRFDIEEDEQLQAIQLVLSIIENILEMKSSSITILLKTTNILEFLIKIISNKSFSNLKLSCSEMLSILLQGSIENYPMFCKQAFQTYENKESNGMSILLESIAQYRKKELTSIDEEEMLNNLFVSLDTLLLQTSCQYMFLEEEGLELMIKCIKDRKYSSIRAIKTIKFAISKNIECCIHLINIGGLKYIFSLLLGKHLPILSNGNKKVSTSDKHDIEVNILSIISNLCIYILGNTSTSNIPLPISFILKESNTSNEIPEDQVIQVFKEYKIRLLNKLIENDYEKTLVLLELFCKYWKRVLQVDNEIRLLITSGKVNELEMDEEELMQKRLDGGLFTCQEIAIILTFIANVDVNVMDVTTTSNSVLDKIDEKLSHEGLSIIQVIEILDENIEFLIENLQVNKNLIHEATIVNDSMKDEQYLLVHESFTINVLIENRDNLLQKLANLGKVDFKQLDIQKSSS